MGTIAKLAFKETLYKRIFLITVLMTIAFLIFYGIAVHYSANSFADLAATGDPSAAMQRTFIAPQLLGVGLFFANFLCVLLTILSGVSSISSEIDSHQIDTILARPLPRRSVVFGKFVGLGGLLWLYSILLYVSILLIDHWIGGQLRFEVTTTAVLQATVMFSLIPLVLIAVALWLSSRTSTINGGIIMIILFGVGFIGGFVEQIGAVTNNQALGNIGIVSSLIFPVDAMYRKSSMFLFNVGDDPLAMSHMGLFGSFSEPSKLMIVYSLLYGVLFLYLAVRKFGRRDL